MKIRLYEKRDRLSIYNIISTGLLNEARNDSEFADTKTQLTVTLQRDLDRFDRFAEKGWKCFNEKFWVGVVNECVVACVGLTKIQRQPKESKEMVCLHRLSVKSECRGRKYGKLLMEHLENYVRLTAIKRIRLTTQENLEVAVKMYEARGYKLVERKRQGNLVLLKYQLIFQQ